MVDDAIVANVPKLSNLGFPVNRFDAVASARKACADLLLAYAWGKVCFSCWDDCLAHVSSLCMWDTWPEWLQSALHALYPAYFVYGSVRRLTGPEGPRAHASSKRAVLLLAAACVLLGVRGARAGERARRLARRTV